MAAEESDLCSVMLSLHAELGGEIAALRTDFRYELRAMRVELREDIVHVRDEIRDVRAALRGVHTVQYATLVTLLAGALGIIATLLAQ